MKDEFPLWRLVLKDKATWKELNEYYSVEDAEKMNAVLDLESALTDAYMTKVEDN